MLHYINRGRQQCKGWIRPSLPHTQARSSLSLPLSFSELSVCISLLPSHLSDLTVGGSPPEPPPVSADFLLQVHASRRSGDEAIGRNRLARQEGGTQAVDTNDKDKSSTIENHWVGKALFPPGRGLPATTGGGA